MKIYYYADRGTKIPPLRRQIVSRWLQIIAKEMGKRLGEITYKFTNDEGILAVNIGFLQHNYYTDILTFDGKESNEDPDLVKGDILISLERVAANASKLQLPYEDELHRVLIHGVLHLCGLDDHTISEARKMRIAEDRALYLIHQLVGEGASLFKPLTK